jgi:hypothetical protein
VAIPVVCVYCTWEVGKGATGEGAARTLSSSPLSPLFLQEAIEAIAESAFKTSPYPVILSFENHVDSCVFRPIWSLILYLSPVSWLHLPPH